MGIHKTTAVATEENPIDYCLDLNLQEWQAKFE